MAESKTPVKKVAKKVTAKKVATKKVVAKKVAAAPVAKRSSANRSAGVTGASYIYAVGRRKTASVQARLFIDSKEVTVVNGRPLEKYFGTPSLINNVLLPIKTVGFETRAAVSLLAQGGGMSGQSDAAKLAIARALVKHDPLLRPALKAAGLLTRDARKVERKKPGLKKARKSPQWAKR